MNVECGFPNRIVNVRLLQCQKLRIIPERRVAQDRAQHEKAAHTQHRIRKENPQGKSYVSHHLGTASGASRRLASEE